MLIGNERRRGDQSAQQRGNGEAFAVPPGGRQPGQCEGSSDAEEKSDIEGELRRPDRPPQQPVDRFGQGRCCGRRADGEQQRPADRMAVRRYDAPAQHMRAPAERFGIVDPERLAGEAEGSQRPLRSIGQNEEQPERRHRLAEFQREGRRRSFQHRAVGRSGADERGMGEGRGGRGDQEGQKQQAKPHPAGQTRVPCRSSICRCREHDSRTGTTARFSRGAPSSHHFFGSSLRPGAGNSSSSASCPAAGMAIQRSAAPSSHSCTTGK